MSLADKLDKAGHDVERVVEVNDLGEGIDDTAIRLYAVEEDRVIVTSHDDFARLPASSHNEPLFHVGTYSLRCPSELSC